jgi:hypothetical protein
MFWCSDSPEDQVISLFAGLFDNPDVPLSPNNMSPGNSRTKYVDLKIKWLQDHLQKGDIKIHHVPTSLNVADILTKALIRETSVRCIANDLKPDDIVPPITQDEGEF